MKRALFFLLAFGALATSAAAQTSGWDTGNSWDAPKKSTTKKTAKSSQSQAAGQKNLQKGGAAAAPEPEMVATPAPAAAAAPAPAAGFGGAGAATSNAPQGMGMSAAPGTPVMMQSGRNVMANDAAAARERRLNRKIKHHALPLSPSEVPKTAAAAAAPAPVAAPAPAPAADAMATGTAANGGAGNGAMAAPKANVKASSTPKKAAPKAAKKAPASDGW
ncbi:hypothetical protein [Hymenobacter terricola]|uniref:hypothetical protein n=1 Tax=Hymenobacter terricola TaxID=2819236 RepID=UPI001B304075|nr:hypothetical protein [Hymenobacter terricola]